MSELPSDNDSRTTPSIPSLRIGCGSLSNMTEAEKCCPICGSKNIGYDFFANLVCKDCGYIEFGAST